MMRLKDMNRSVFSELQRFFFFSIIYASLEKCCIHIAFFEVNTQQQLI